MLLRSVWADLALSRSLDSPPLCPIVGAFPGFPECLASAMAASSWRGAVLFRTVSGLRQPGPDAAREWMTRLPSLLGCQRRCVSCVAGPTFSGPRLASASRPNGQNSALDCFLGLSQPDNSLPFRVPAVSVLAQSPEGRRVGPNVGGHSRDGGGRGLEGRPHVAGTAKLGVAEAAFMC